METGKKLARSLRLSYFFQPFDAFHGIGEIPEVPAIIGLGVMEMVLHFLEKMREICEGIQNR
jgi:hypothetical protein